MLQGRYRGGAHPNAVLGSALSITLDYRIPVASDLPMIDTVIVEVANPMHPYGVRGVGETPIVPPLAAVANAVQRAAGVEIRELPISPPRLLELLEDSR
jgi:CO/xanthine dehydrogenase Mo-binding subunit